MPLLWTVDARTSVEMSASKYPMKVQPNAEQQ